jgi:YHS domain-containing protein
MKHILTAITLYVLVTASASFAGIELNTTTGWTLKGAPLAVHGFDPVAYFTQNEALLGDAQFSTEYKEGTYRFISEANKQLFLKNPSAYVPQYGGYCAFGTAKGKKFDGDPRLFKVVDGKLYFNLNPDVYKKWLMDPPGYIQQADENWREIHDKQPAELW